VNEVLVIFILGFDTINLQKYYQVVTNQSNFLYLFYLLQITIN